MTQTKQLSSIEINSLMSSNVIEYQQDLVKKLTTKYNAVGVQPLKNNDVNEANNIFRELLRTAEVEVRSVLAMNLSHNDSLPIEIVQMIAADVSDVAAPMLQFSSVFSDEELLNIINQEANASKLEAIARRATVSETVSDALIDTRIESVVQTVVKNDGAEISDNSFMKIAERHSDSEMVMSSLLQRSSVPVEVVQRVIERVSASMREALEVKYGNLESFKTLKTKLDQSIEVISLKMLGFKSTDAGLMKVLSYLDGSNKMTPFSALCMPNMKLFEISLARLLNIPVKNMEILMQDKNGFKRIYEKADLPEFLFEAAEIALQAIRAVEAHYAREGLSKDMITPAEVLSGMREIIGDRDIQGIDYLYALLQQSMRKIIGGTQHA